MRLLFWMPVFLLICSSVLSVSAQRELNPFDLQPRLGQAVDSSAAPGEQLGNPFDIHVPPPPPVEVAPTSPTGEEIPPEKVETILLDDAYRRFLFVTVFVSLVVLTILITLFRSIAQKSYRAFTNDNMLNQIHRDQGAIVAWPYLLFYLYFFFNLGLFIFLVCHHYGIDPGSTYLQSLLLFTGGAIAAFGVKHLLLKIVEYVFSAEKEVKAYSFTIVVFSIVLGLALVPFILLLAYGPENLRQAFIYAAFAMIALVYAFRSIRGFLLSVRLLGVHKFHFLLYICTVEIAPVLLLVKVLLLQTEGGFAN